VGERSSSMSNGNSFANSPSQGADMPAWARKDGQFQMLMSTKVTFWDLI
jgi:hypothetical protein